jgi:hypothetical protein
MLFHDRRLHHRYPLLSCSAISLRAWTRMAGQRSRKIPAPVMQMSPPAATVAGAPKRLAAAPAISEPIGAIPMNIIE